MSAEPLVSIVLPTYNGARYLDQSVASCVAQTYRNWELIIVDDCSTDATPQIVSKWVAADPRVRAVRHETNQRLPGGLNTGHRLARGDYLTWTSDDNLYRPDAIGEMVRFLETNPDVGLVYTDYTNIDDDGNVMYPHVVAEPQRLAYESCVGACFLYRRAVWEKVGEYASDMFLAEDFEYWVRVSQSFKLQPLHKDLYLYRLHAGSLTAQRHERVVLAIGRVVERHLPRMDWVPRSYRARGHLVLAGIAERQGKRALALKHIAQSIRYSPLELFLRLGRWAKRTAKGRRRSRLPAA
jgi:glycosyltransferase involved in cell wall biosynthesis